MSIRSRGLPTCSPGSPITRLPTWPRCYPGIGAAPSRSSAPPDCGSTSSRDHAAEILGEDEELLWELVTDMEPEDGCLWIYDTDDEQTVAFTPDGIEYLREMLPEYKRNRSPPAVLNGWLRRNSHQSLTSTMDRLP